MQKPLPPFPTHYNRKTPFVTSHKSLALMSFVLRARKKSSTPLPATGLWVIVGLAAVFFLVRYGTELLREHDLREKARQQAVTNAALRDDNARLQSSLLYYQSDHYIEQRAREDLNLRRPDEAVLIPILAPAPTSDDEYTAAPQVAESVEIPPPLQRDERDNWELWADLFAPSR